MLLESYPSSSYRDESQYWIALVLFPEERFSEGHRRISSLIRQSPKSPFVPSSLLKIGDGYYNLKQYDQAVKSYLQVVKEYPKSKEAPEADFGIILSLLQEKKYDPFIARVELL